jgi:peptidylprolyl isomerase
MKLTSILLFSSIALAQPAVLAQKATPAKPQAASHPAAATAAAHACSKLPPMSPKIPALPAGLPCFKPLYTINSMPPVKISDAPLPVVASVVDYFGFGPTIVSLSYVDTKVGTGEPAALHKWYSVKYTGYLVDGTVFDSSDNHADHAPFVLQQGVHKVIPGWDTGFYGMRVGGRRRLFIPFQLAYGARANGAVPANADLIFDIELVSQSDKDPAPAPKAPPAPPAAAAPTRPTPPAQPATGAPAAPSAAPSTLPAAAQPATAPNATPPKPQ